MFLASPWLWLMVAAFSVLILFACLIVPVFGPALFLALFPVLLAGSLLLSRELAEERPLRLASLWPSFRARLGGLGQLGVISALLMYAAWSCARILAGGASSYATLLTGLLLVPLALPILLAASFAPALLLFNEMSALAALRASFNACASNWLALGIFAVLFLMLILLTLISVGLGLLLLIPVMSGALFAAYRDIFPGT